MKCDDCRDTGCRSCWPTPDMKALVESKISEVLQTSAEEVVEEGFAVACCLNKTRNWGPPRGWNIHFFGTPYGGVSTAHVPINQAILFTSREDAVDFAKSKRVSDGPFRIVHVRRFARPAPVFLSHSPIDILDALAETA